MSKTTLAAAVLGLTLLGFSSNSQPAHGQIFMENPGASGALQNIEGFTVSGKGSVSARPNAVEVELNVSSASELTADAIVKYRDARRRVRDAFTALKLENVAIEERGLLVDEKGMVNPYYFGWQQNTRAKTEVQLSRKLVVKASNIRGMDEDALLQLVGKLLDVAQDAGAKVGAQNEFNPYVYRPFLSGNGLVRFVVDDFEKLQEEAYERAIADARLRAERLAKLSHVELGSIVAVREVAVPGEPSPAQQAQSPEELPRKRLESTKFQEIPIRVELLVRFDVHPKSESNKGRVGAR
jgi:uncharacterized protein YggE